MNRKCTKCNEEAIKVRLLTFSSRMYCEKCFAQFEYTSLSKWILAFGGAFIPMVAVYTGLFLKNWLVFGFILIIVPFIAEFIFAKYCSLKLVGIKVLREKLRAKSL